MPVGKPPNQANLPNNGGPTVAEAAVAPLRPSDCAPRSTRRCFRKSGRGSPLLPFCYQTRWKIAAQAVLDRTLRRPKHMKILRFGTGWYSLIWRQQFSDYSTWRGKTRSKPSRTRPARLARAGHTAFECSAHGRNGLYHREPGDSPLDGPAVRELLPNPWGQPGGDRILCGLLPTLPYRPGLAVAWHKLELIHRTPHRELFQAMRQG